MLDGSTQLSNVEQIQLFVDMTILVVGISAVWCLQTAHEQRSVVTAPDFELAKMELQRLASEEEVLSRKQRSRIARIEYEAKKALSQNRSPRSQRRRARILQMPTSKKPADATQQQQITRWNTIQILATATQETRRKVSLPSWLV